MPWCSIRLCASGSVMVISSCFGVRAAARRGGYSGEGAARSLGFFSPFLCSPPHTGARRDAAGLNRGAVARAARKANHEGAAATEPRARCAYRPRVRGDDVLSEMQSYAEAADFRAGRRLSDPRIEIEDPRELRRR